MKFIKGLLIGLVLVAAIAIAVGLLLPASAHVERSILINAPAAQVMPYLTSMQRFNEWSPWYGADPDAEFVFTGPDRGPGSTMRWKSDDPSLGEGAMAVTAVERNERVEMVLDFGDQGTADSWITLDEQSTGTEVTWGFDVRFGWNPVERYFGLLMDRLVGQEYEKGLAKLKAVVEG